MSSSVVWPHSGHFIGNVALSFQLPLMNDMMNLLWLIESVNHNQQEEDVEPHGTLEKSGLFLWLENKKVGLWWDKMTKRKKTEKAYRLLNTRATRRGDHPPAGLIMAGKSSLIFWGKGAGAYRFSCI